MTNTLQISQLTKHSLSSTDNMYNCLLGITSDGLYILNLDKTLLLEIIVDGYSNVCVVCSAHDEDTFLDAILFIKTFYNSWGGNDPPFEFFITGLWMDYKLKTQHKKHR